MDYGCRIGKVKYKSGAELTVLPKSTHNVSNIRLGWGEVSARCFDGKPMTTETLFYMLECAKTTVMNGRAE